MSVQLPQVVAAYFAGKNVHNVESMLASFTETAIVKDARREFRGKSEIREWMEDAYRKYSAVVQVVEASELDGKLAVVGRVTGSFPGTFDLRYITTLANGKISHLEIQDISPIPFAKQFPPASQK